ncbi:pyridoxal phosphate-dependent transferase [Protomyces lactucae-debilis]|uniref:phosphoserine transaminase n=1 Tax=Protomyces lactucae-debilis TaxID=2754530 RepID=A0A1Y2FNM2_PROLT|nr:pyridoxal phosphate-dependent transferase [Protomyces lactucae-debilis]ORY84934.1 pyridoxal phosphate-dependent transferase [Protomyces lactucae-debilis]
MPTREEIVNFGAGPATLPTAVMQQAAKDLVNYEDSGMGIGELSHRSSTCANLLKRIQKDLTTLLSIPDTHSVLFMQGGGTTQFSATVYNMLAYWIAKDGSAGGQRICDYLVTGSWSAKAASEAKCLGANINVVTDSRALSNSGKAFGDLAAADTFQYTPKDKAAFVWYCDNETIDGVEFPGLPEGVDPDVPLVCDMSSNFASRPIDVSKYAVIYAGAQKNVGLAGLTVLIVKNEFMQQRAEADAQRQAGAQVTPIMLDYQTIWKNDSLYNTLPIFTLHVTGLVFAHLLAEGGIDHLERVNKEKAALLYGVLDAEESIVVVPAKHVRSRMNVCFKFTGAEAAERESAFLKAAEARGMVQLKGHRSVGGLRASLYNAISLVDTQKLAKCIEDVCRA